jgi:multiple sugar transport system substrate-binding protein
MIHIFLKLLKLICISSILFSLICCDNYDSNRIEITFWAMGAEGEQVQKLIPKFELENPDLRIRVQMVPWTAAQEKLITAFASENLPDIFQLGNTWVPQFVALEAIECLDPWISESDSIGKENYFDGIWDTNVIAGSVYGIPWYIDTRVLFYRKDILKRAGFEKPPKTWQELYVLSKKIKEIGNNFEKYAIYLPTNEWAPFVIFGLQAGSGLLKDDNCYANFSADNFKKGFEFLIRFHKEKLAPIGISQVTNVYQAFSEEYFVMYISGPWNIREFKKWMSGKLADQWMTATLPGPDESTPGLSLAGGSSLVLTRISQHKREAWRFIEYLSQKSTQVEFYKLLNDLPALKVAWQDSVLINDPYIQAFYEQFHHVTATPKIPEWEQIAYSKVQQCAEIAARGVMSVDAALKSLDKDVDKILEKRRWLLGK